MRPKEIRTARLRLMPLAPDDVSALHKLWTAPGVRKYLWDDRVLRLEQTRDLVMQSGYLYEQHGYGLWGAFDADGMMVGFCGYWFFRNDHELELLYGVDEGAWLQGYAREMAQAMVSYGFEQLTLPELRATTEAPNTGSQRVLKRLGFVPDFQRGAGGATLYFRLPRGRRDGAPLPADAF